MRLMSDASLWAELLITRYPITYPPPIRTAYKIPKRAYNNAIFVYFEETLSRQPFALFGFRVWRLNKFFRRSPISRRDILCLHYNILTVFCQAFYTVFWKFLSIKLQFYYTLTSRWKSVKFSNKLAGSFRLSFSSKWRLRAAPPWLWLNLSSSSFLEVPFAYLFRFDELIIPQ